MTKLYKLVITGAFNAGKTTFIKTLSEIDPVNTDKTTDSRAENRIKATTTVALDYGKVKLNQHSAVHLFGTPGQDRFDFMREILAEEMHGFIFLVDSTDRYSLNQATKLLRVFKEHKNVPFLLAANKADKKGLSGEEIRQALNLPARQPVVPCVATDKKSARAVVEQLIAMIEAG
ncbi:MAG: GTP-binding protein [Chloroflexi bacterium]|nr:GTP-binding protein [Chloroflexota bacterium]